MATDRLLGPKSPTERLRHGHGVARILAGLALLLPPLVVLAPLGMAPLLVIVALATVALAARPIAQAFPRLTILAALLVALGVWAATSALWSIIPGHSFFEGTRFIGESLCGLCIIAAAAGIEPGDRAPLARALIGGLVAALVLLAIERFAGAPIVHWWHGTPTGQFESLGRYDRGVTVLVLLMAPVAVGAAAAWLRVALLAAIVAAAALMLSACALMAALAALAIYALARSSSRFMAGAMIAGVVRDRHRHSAGDTELRYGTAALHAEAPWIKYSGIHRLLIWRFSADRKSPNDRYSAGAWTRRA